MRSEGIVKERSRYIEEGELKIGCRMPSRQSPTKPTGGKEEHKSTKRRHVETYSGYIYRLLKQLHAELGISKKGMSIVNSFVNDIFERLALQAAELVRCNKKRTLSAREIQTAVRFVLPGELAKHAVAEGIKACTKHANI